MSSLWLYNGKLGGSVSVQDRGLAYGDGLFETILLKNSACPFATWHRQRLSVGCERLGIALDEDRLSQEFNLFKTALAEQKIEQGVIKLIVTRGDGGKGYRPGVTAANTLWQYRELPNNSAQSYSSLGLSVSPIRLSHQPLFAGLKHLNRLENVMAAVRSPPNIEPLLLDAQDQVIETLSHNIFAVFNDQIITPTLDKCGVAGVLRQWLFDVAEANDIAISEQPLSLAKLLSADGIFIGNSVRGFSVVSELEGRKFGELAMFKRVQSLHQQYLIDFCNV